MGGVEVITPAKIRGEFYEILIDTAEFDEIKEAYVSSLVLLMVLRQIHLLS